MKEFLKKYWHLVIAFILFLMAIFYTVRGNAAENPHARQHIQLAYCKALRYEDCTTIKEKYKFHKENAERCFNEAKDRCWWLPRLSDRENARYCITNAGALVAIGDPRSKLIAVVVNTLIQYGLDCCDEWDYINNKLYWSQYHYEMMEFYQQAMQ